MVRLIVLGLLKIRPMSGYEIQHVMQVSQMDIWAGVLPGSIYHALKKMDKEGLVAVDTVEQTGHRIKAIYKITESGQEEFTKLLLESLRVKSMGLPSTLYMAISFLPELSAEEGIESLSEQKDILESELEVLRSGLKTKEQYVTVDGIMKLQFENMFSHYELQIDFINKLIHHLEQNGTGRVEAQEDSFEKFFE